MTKHQGTKIVTDIELDNVYPLIATHTLFVGRWQFKRTPGTEEAYQEILKQKILPAFEEWKDRCKDEAILEPKVVYGYFTAGKIASSFIPSPLMGEGKGEGAKIFPLQLVTVGDKAVQKCQWLFAAHRYTDYLYLHGLAAVTAEALAEYWHRQILRELGVSFNAGKRLPAGSRISPGYKVWPNLADQKELCRLLDAGRIGVSITETYQLVPEYSTSAMIVLG